MPDLKHSVIFRGGSTASRLFEETNDCFFCVNENDKSLELRFDIASKGGGETSILVQVGSKDFPVIFTELAKILPGEAGVLSNAAATANKLNVKRIKQLTKSVSSEHREATELLEEIYDYVGNECTDATTQDHENNSEILIKLDQIFGLLRNDY